jgi:Bacterial RNA polymerase, alpha chain C terminal domain/Sigma-70, region 4
MVVLEVKDPMPPSQKKIEINARRAVVRRLLEIGLREAEIRRALDLSTTEARYDILKITEKNGDTNEPLSEIETPRSTYREALRVYAGLAAGLNEKVAGLRDALRSYLDINHLTANCEGVAAALQTSLANSENKRLEGYKRLVMEVFDEREDKEISGNEILSNFLSAVHKGDAEPVEREGMPEALAKWALATYVRSIAPLPISAKAAQYIDNNILRSLTPREEHVIKLRFGLGDGRARTLVEIAQEFRITSPRVREIKEKALRRLRRPILSKFLFLYAQPMDVISDEIVEKEMWRNEPIHLDRRIDHCGLPHEVSLILARADIETIGQLCAKSEIYLSILPGITQKMLAEIKTALSTLDLALAGTDAVAIPEPQSVRKGKPHLGLTDDFYKLQITVRSYNGLKALGVRTIADICRLSEADLEKAPNLGKKSIQEIKMVLKELGLWLGMALPENLEVPSAVFEAPPEPPQPTEATPIPTETRMMDFYWVIGNRGSKERCYPALGEKLTDWELMAYVAFNAAFDSRYSVEPDGQSQPSPESLAERYLPAIMATDASDPTRERVKATVLEMAKQALAMLETFAAAGIRLTRLSNAEMAVEPKEGYKFPAFDPYGERWVMAVWEILDSAVEEFEQEPVKRSNKSPVN